ncbi:MAG: rhamnulokinase [Kiritimatiellae bacterium]|nr:rhamnulokinase [Kiritimatiellia bacterium]
MTYRLAIDIGASSGRHILGHIEDGRIVLEEIYRFDNSQIRRGGHDCWDHEALVRHVVAGIKACAAAGKIPSTIGIDTWGVDFILLDDALNPCSDMVAYRDARTDGMDAEVEKTLPFAEHYARTGIQKAIFNTVYQLAALKREHPEQLEKAAHFLMVPDYLNFRLTGRIANEYTDATTTALVNAREKTWDAAVLERLGLPRRIFGELSMPGTALGGLSPEVRDEVGFDATVVLPAAHDTGSAYLAVPARDDRAVYLSSGTWSIVGVENTEPIATPESCAANFSNEGGAWYRFRFLKNIMGLWMMQSVRRELNGVEYVEGKGRAATEKALSGLGGLKAPGEKWSFPDLIEAAKGAVSFTSVVDAADRRFFAPESMAGAICAACAESGQVVPSTVGELVQCIYLSLAASYAKEVRLLAGITGKDYTSLNIVGGGCQDAYLNALTAKATGLEVFAGPVEGTSIGNLIVQFIHGGEFADLAAARAAVAKSLS